MDSFIDEIFTFPINNLTKNEQNFRTKQYVYNLSKADLQIPYNIIK